MKQIEIFYEKRWSSLRVKIIRIELAISLSNNSFVQSYLRANKDEQRAIINTERAKLQTFLLTS
jgi:hypothetical protein